MRANRTKNMSFGGTVEHKSHAPLIITTTQNSGKCAHAITGLKRIIENAASDQVGTPLQPRVHDTAETKTALAETTQHSAISNYENYVCTDKYSLV